MKEKAKISVLIPSYNDADSLCQTLDSVMNQDYKNFEIIFIDDGSTDNTKEILENYKKTNDKNNKIKYLYEDNKDQLNALLNGINFITGDYISVLHSDDLYPDNNYFSKCISFFKTNKNIDSIIGDLLIIDKDGKVVNRWKALDYINKPYIPALLILNNGCNIYGDCGMHRKKVYLKQIKNNYLIWNTPFWYDFETNKILNIKTVDFPILKYRIYDNNYISNELGKFNAINGEIRTLTRIMSKYNIKYFKFQRTVFQLLRQKGIRKMCLSNKYQPYYKNQTQEDSSYILNKCLLNTYNETEILNNIFLNSINNFYKTNLERTIYYKQEISDDDLYYGKDIRAFTKKLFADDLSPLYRFLFDEMNIGFNKIAVLNEAAKVKMELITKFLCLYPYVKIVIADNQQEKIPKIIHYVWMGNKEKPKAIKKCMKTWKKYLKDYRIIEWNEKNFDINSHSFVKAAYKAKKWAFVSDYVRAWAIYKYGGVYFDTDIFMIDSIDDLLSNRCFVGYEHPDFPFTAVFGAVSGHPLIKDMLDYYDKLENYAFNFENNNTISVSSLLVEKYGCKLGNVEQTLKTGIKVYKDDVLCNPSLNSKTVHVFLGSWLDNSKFKAKLHEFLRMKLHNKTNIYLYTVYKNIKLKLHKNSK